MKRITVLCVFIGIVFLCFWGALSLITKKEQPEQQGVEQNSSVNVVINEDSDTQSSLETNDDTIQSTESAEPNAVKHVDQMQNPIPASLNTIWDVEGKRGHFERKRAAQNLGDRLSRAEIVSLYEFLGRPDPDFDDSPLALNSIKNDILDFLIKQEDLPPDLGMQIVSMAQNQQLDDVWRDYCVQHFEHYYRAKWPVGQKHTDDAEKAEIIDAYNEALTEKSSRISGTALLGMDHLSRDYPDLKAEMVTELAIKMANDVDYSATSRITALRICGKRKCSEVLPVTRSIIKDDSEVLLRLAAIATLSEIGGDEDIALLRENSEQASSAVSKAINSAIAKIQERIDGAKI